MVVLAGDAGMLHEACAEEIALVRATEFEQFAIENCQITHPLPTYNPQFDFKPTPAEYAAGAREANSRNAWHAHCRHRCTNYDALLVGLDRYNPFDTMKYIAIKGRIHAMLEHAFEECRVNEEDEDEEDLIAPTDVSDRAARSSGATEPCNDFLQVAHQPSDGGVLAR